jgi:hypothetical protein
MNIWKFTFGIYQTKEFYKNKERFIDSLAKEVLNKKKKN